MIAALPTTKNLLLNEMINLWMEDDMKLEHDDNLNQSINNILFWLTQSYIRLHTNADTSYHIKHL